MDGIPKPDSDLIFQLLKLVGVPSLVLLPIELLMAWRAWVHFGRTLRVRAGIVSDAATRRLDKLPVVVLILYVLLQGVVAASLYTLFEMFRVINTAEDQYGRGIDSGRLFTWDEVSAAFTYTTDTPAFTAFLVVLGVLLTFNAALLMGLGDQARIVAIVVACILWVGGAVFSFLAYTVSTDPVRSANGAIYLYRVVAACPVLAAFCCTAIPALSRKVFPKVP